MNNFAFVSVAILLVGTILVFGEKVSPDEQLFQRMPKGRLLKPQEGCGLSKVANKRIVGGSEAKIGQYPWMALLGHVDATEDVEIFFCGGTLITSKNVLTAAHCIRKDAARLNTVRLGEHDTRTTSDGQHIDVGIAFSDVHEEYDDVIDLNDIAILHLANDVEFNNRIRPICLPMSVAFRGRSFVDYNAFLAGWGNTKTGEKRSPVLNQVQVPIIKNEDCKKSYKRIDQVFDDTQFDDRVICAGFTAGGHDSCQGDSGGPLMLPIEQNGTFPFFQIGIISYADGCGKPNIPGVNTNVQSYIRWIKRKLFM